MASCITGALKSLQDTCSSSEQLHSFINSGNVLIKDGVLTKFNFVKNGFFELSRVLPVGQLTFDKF